jgi:sulfate/thiosulfate transport system permease protein
MRWAHSFPLPLDGGGSGRGYLGARSRRGGRTLSAAALTSRPPYRVIPGFGLTLGLTLTYLGLIVLLPLAALLLKAAEIPPGDFLAVLRDPRVAAAFQISFGIAFAAALINAAVGLLVAWVLVRYRFPGRRLLDGLVDLPFALPTAVAGIALATLYADTGWIGAIFARFGIDIAFTPLGILVALVFIGLPFVVRTVQPILADLAHDAEEAALTLGARPWQIFFRVVLPALLPGIFTGASLAFARGLGEYGSVIFIAGNMPGVSEIVPLLIVIKLEQFDYPGAAALGAAMLAASFALLLAINLGQLWVRRRHGV